MFALRQQALLAPLDEANKSEVGVCADLDLIALLPDFQSDQHHTNTHRAVQLK